MLYILPVEGINQMQAPALCASNATRTDTTKTAIVYQLIFRI